MSNSCFFYQIEEPYDIEEALKKLGPLFYKPKIKGRYFHIPDVVAKELLCMKDDILDGYEKFGLSSSTVAIVKIKIRCLFQTFYTIIHKNFSEDGMGCIVSLPTEKQKLQMPNKIFRSSLTILSVEDEETKKLIFKNPTPNTEFSPPICSFITDENDSQSMAGKLY